MMKGAAMMMTMSAVGLGVSSMMGAYQLGGISNASRAGDEADLQSMDEGNSALNKTSQDSLDASELATSPGGLKSTEQNVKAQNAIKQMENTTKEQQAKGVISDDQANSYNAQAANSRKALEQSQYQTGGLKNPDGDTEYEGTPAHAQAQLDLAAAKKAGTVDPSTTIDTPEQAVAFYHAQARSLAATRPQGNIYAQMANPDISPWTKKSQ